MNRLEEQYGGHGGKTKSTSGCTKGRCSAVRAAALVRGRVALSSGILNLATAEVATLKQLLVMKWLIESTGCGNVVGRLEVEGTFDTVNLGGFDPAVN